jgi:hypothetical protein
MSDQPPYYQSQIAHGSIYCIHPHNVEEHIRDSIIANRDHKVCQVLYRRLQVR